MEFVGFEYVVRVQLELTAADLRLLRTLCGEHYDHCVKSTFHCGHFGNGWWNSFEWKHGHFPDASEDDGETVQICAKFQHLDRLAKALEIVTQMGMHRELWDHALTLNKQIRSVLNRINGETVRLQETA